MSDYTHDDLVKLAAKKLRQSCSIIITEMSGGNEIPDALGFGYNSVLIEAKASRSDFLKDKNKYFRRTPKHGMGEYRFYIAPKGIIKPEELPENWGLYEPRGSRIFEVVKGKKFNDFNMVAERNILISAMRKIGKHCPAGGGIGVDFYTYELSTSVNPKTTIGLVKEA